MPELPTGTVTFLFTDIEGSTRLLHELGDRYAEVLAEHRRVLREAFDRHGGVEVDTQGDAFFVAFARASDAVAAAAEAQEALAAGPVRVRMGLHTGEPTRTEEGYVGIDVHRAARIAAAGHGGQVLVSQTTRDLLDEQFELRDLGEHRLKDLAAPQRLYQLGGGEFPPLKSLYQTNLPVVATPFLGREREVAEVVDRLRDARLVTLTGPGGTGKTRLALQAAAEAVEEFEHGVFWVGVAALRDPELVLPTIAQAVSARDDVSSHIGEKKMLLLVDNFEQVVEAAAGLGELLSACSNLKLLVTSREPLHLEGEWEYAVQPLREAEAVALFEQRARAVRADFSPNGEVAEICLRLDCLPLAVELAAARVKVLSPAAILERLEQRLPLLTGGVRNAPERQRALRATIEWSYDLLSAEEQDLFSRLAVFAGGCTLEAAEDVCGAELDALQSLVDKSLVRHSEDRFWMLETIREFAGERFSTLRSAPDLRSRHALHYLGLAELAEPELVSSDQRRWLDRLEIEHDNLRTALAWAQGRDDVELGLRLAVPLWRFWRVHNHRAEGRRVLEALVPAEAAPAELRARALVGASRLAMDEGDVAGSLASAEEALAAAQRSRSATEVAAATENLGVMTSFTPAKSRALALLEEGVVRFRELGDPIGTADALNNLGQVLLEVGETERAAEVGEEALRLQREEDNTRGIQFVLHSLGYVALRKGDLELARGRLTESVILAQELGDVASIGWCVEGLAQIAAGQGSDRRAAVLWAAGETIRSEAGVYMQPSEEAIHDDALAAVRTRMGEAAYAEALVEGAALTSDDAVAFAVALETTPQRTPRP